MKDIIYCLWYDIIHSKWGWKAFVIYESTRIKIRNKLFGQPEPYEPDMPDSWGDEFGEW